MKKILIILTSLLVSLSSFAQVKTEFSFSKSNFQTIGVYVGVTEPCPTAFESAYPVGFTNLVTPATMFSRGVRLGCCYLDHASAQQFSQSNRRGYRASYDWTRVGFNLGILNISDIVRITPSINYACGVSTISDNNDTLCDANRIESMNSAFAKHIGSFGGGLDLQLRIGQVDLVCNWRTSKYDYTFNAGVYLPIQF